ncbi:MAG TPA: hypothetical protein VH643_21235 [Gemmataceae bacterium]|jgi:hypothetical protein
MRTTDPFDPDALRAPNVDLASLCNRPSKRPPRHRNGEAFLKGPIPWSWLERACRLPGKALHVPLLLWKEAGCRNSRTVTLCLARPAALGMHVDTASRGLRALASAGLVSIRRQPGKPLEVTLLDAPMDKPAG